jgi:hypothetical protein
MDAQEETVYRWDSRLQSVTAVKTVDHEAIRLAFLEQIRQLMGHYVRSGAIHRVRPRVDRRVIVRIIVDQDDTVSFDECLDCLLVLVAYSVN